MYVLTRGAQTVLPDEVPNLAQGGLRGLMRVIGMEQPRMRPTQIDVDDATDVGLVARRAALQLRRGRDGVARRPVLRRPAQRDPLQAEERHTTVVRPERDGMRLQIRTPGDLQSAELVAYERIPPGPGQIEVAVSASNLNFADVLVAYGRYPSFEGGCPSSGADFAGVVTAVGAGVTDHQIGDRVAGISATGAWCTFVTCDAQPGGAHPPGHA